MKNAFFITIALLFLAASAEAQILGVADSYRKLGRATQSSLSRTGSAIDRSNPNRANTNRSSPTRTARSTNKAGTLIRVAADVPRIDPAGPLPNASQIIETYAAAAGHTTNPAPSDGRSATGTVDMPGFSSGGKLELFAKDSNKRVLTMALGTLGTIKVGLTGQKGWEQSARGVRELRGLELAVFQLDADFYNPDSIKALYPKLTVLGKAHIGYREAYVVQGSSGSGDVARFYFETESGLPIRVDATGGRALAVIYLDEWQEVDGVKLPFRVTETFQGVSLVFAFEEVKRVALEDAVFERPGR
jgi:hypothetical protein